jgi:hypothetical protein
MNKGVNKNSHKGFPEKEAAEEVNVLSGEREIVLSGKHAHKTFSSYDYIKLSTVLTNRLKDNQLQHIHVVYVVYYELMEPFGLL